MKGLQTPDICLLLKSILLKTININYILQKLHLLTFWMLNHDHNIGTIRITLSRFLNWYIWQRPSAQDLFASTSPDEGEKDARFVWTLIHTENIFELFLEYFILFRFLSVNWRIIKDLQISLSFQCERHNYENFWDLGECSGTTARQRRSHAVLAEAFVVCS